nr:uncharacterized protein LOC127333479 [Lolium perenne]
MPPLRHDLLQLWRRSKFDTDNRAGPLTPHRQDLLPGVRRIVYFLNIGDFRHFLSDPTICFFPDRIAKWCGEIRQVLRMFLGMKICSMKTTLARLPFRLGLGRVMDATGYLQDS